MKRSHLIILLLLFIILTACSSSKELFIGDWILEQISQVESKQFELTEYKYCEVKESEIFLNDVIKTENGKDEVRTLDDTNKVNYEYKWITITKKEIELNGETYGVEVSTKQLIIKNDELELLFMRAE